MSRTSRFFKSAFTAMLLTFVAVNLIVAQVPPQPGFSYQAVARDQSGNPLEQQALTVRIGILQGGANGPVIWQEDHDVTTNPLGMFDLVVGGPQAYGQSGTVDAFSDIDWTADVFFLNVMVKKDADFLDMGGSIIQTVPVAQYAKTAKASSGNFSVKADREANDGETLFEVRRSDGSLAFAVYEDMVWVYANQDETKGIKGGFAVGGYTNTKAGEDEYMMVTPDSIRMYINTDETKGIKGGFAVGGYTNTKAPVPQYFNVKGKNVNDDFSISLGVDAVADGQYSTAIGYQSSATGNSSFAAGYNSNAANSNSIAFGNAANSTGVNSTAIGYQSSASGDQSIAIGSYYSYTFSSLPYFNYTGKKNDSKGDFIIWDPIIIPDFRTVTFNRANTAEGRYSIAFGNGNLSSNGGMALGSYNDATAFGAVSLGVSNKASNTNALSAGYSSQATGYYSTAVGNNAYAKSYGSFVIGQYNEIWGDSTQWVNTDPLFIVGNGLNNDHRNNALTIYKDGRSIFKGADANLTLNDRRTFFYYDIISGIFYSYLNVYGVRSYINCSDPDIDNYYSAYFFHTGTEDQNYQGFYADVRAGSSADVAEYIYDSKGNTEAGDVLVADPNKTESVLISDEAYQNSVIGVVTTDPHLVMGMELVIDEESGASKAGVQATRLALTGRVPCKVTDENGPIKPGDLVTTSSTPGHAMKWTALDVTKAKDFDELKKMLAENERRNHAVIGKALEAHDSGSGKIMVLISVQ